MNLEHSQCMSVSRRNNVCMLIDRHQKNTAPVWNSNLVQIRVFAIEEKCIRSPDLLQKLPVHCKLVDDIRLVELESLIIPILSEHEAFKYFPFY